MTLLQKSILSTIVYYDTLDYPLTSFEVFKYLVNPLHVASFYYFGAETSQCDGFSLEVNKLSKINLVNIRKSLESKELKQFIDGKNGFYFLHGKEYIVRTRINHQKIADQKWKKAKHIIGWLQIVPYLRMVALSGSLALNNTRSESDIDVLVVVKSGRIWLTRFFITSLLQMMKKRRHKYFTKDRICLNHYITDKSLEIKFKSLYNAQTYAHMIPTVQIERGIYDKFQASNRWVKDYLVFWPDINTMHFKALKPNYFFTTIAKIFELCLNNSFGNFLEKFSGLLQKRLIEKDPLTFKKGGRITIDNTQLEFHPDSPERKVLDKYNQSMVQLGVKELGQEKDSGLL